MDGSASVAPARGVDTGVGVSVGKDEGACVFPDVAVAISVSVAAAVGVGNGVLVGAGLGIAVDTGVGVDVGSGVGVSVGFGVGTVVGVLVGAGFGVLVGSGVGVAVGSGMGVLVGSGVGMAVGIGVGVSVGTEIGVCVGADDGVAEKSACTPAGPYPAATARASGTRYSSGTRRRTGTRCLRGRMCLSPQRAASGGGDVTLRRNGPWPPRTSRALTGAMHAPKGVPGKFISSGCQSGGRSILQFSQRLSQGDTLEVLVEWARCVTPPAAPPKIARLPEAGLPHPGDPPAFDIRHS
jgi:hypothetical protein